MKQALRNFAFGAALTFAATTAQAMDGVTTMEVDADFATVAQDLNDAIVNKGYVVDYHGFIGDMLKRTAEDVGATETIYKDAEFFTFCSAVVSREVMEVEIGNIAFCPYVLFVYEAAATPGTVTVGFRRLPDGQGRDKVNGILEEIVKEASGDF
ncbi:DUF302 domain-containing protein [Tepidamorphus sp. 3E244]|uniref:DUF302 domain-containing protein n=1 Tax=Tepidamorphus sp. 3E244 TaxID=3385498 RepID=UPI0038FC8C21